MTTLLITAGPSREYFDDVRYLSNASSGRMGIAVAESALARGWRVHLALGPVTAEVPAGVQHHPFVSARELEAQVEALWPEVDALVATAAVCDYRPATRIPGKRKKGSAQEDWRVHLIRNPDILLGRAPFKEQRTFVGFALEPHLDLQEARRKLRDKALDLILLNTPASLGAQQSHYHWLTSKSGTSQLRAEDFLHTDLGAIDKGALGEKIVDYIYQARGSL